MKDKNTINDSWEKSCIPLLVGITGHRDIEDEEGLTERIKEILIDICQKYQHSPVTVLTPLAEGADRAAARAVIELKDTGYKKLSYVVILPMDEYEYKSTFSDGKSVSEYEFLRGQAQGSYKAPIIDTLKIDSIKNKEERHAKLYANMGVYIALNTQVLIAAWNGAEEMTVDFCPVQNRESNDMCTADGARCSNFNIKPGGTYHILRTRFFGVEDEYRGSESYLANREFGPVYWVKARRKSSQYLSEGATVAGPAYPDYPVDYFKFDESSGKVDDNKCRKLVKDLFDCQSNLTDKKGHSEKKTYDKILIKLNQYNRDIYNMNYKHIDQIETSYRDFTSRLHEENNEKKEEKYVFAGRENEMIRQYAAADVLSLHYQHKRKWDIIFLIALAFIALLSFNLYSGPFSSNWLVMAYAGIYLVGSLYYLFIIKNDMYHERYVDYRGIAEGIRIQFFWNLAGIDESVSDKYLTKQKSSVDWIRIALKNVLLLYRTKGCEGNSFLEYKDDIYKGYRLWLLNQNDYYNRKLPGKENTERLQAGIEKLFFIIGLALAMLLAGLDTYEFFTGGTFGINRVLLPINNSTEYEEIHKWMVFAVGFMPVIIASFKVYTEFLAYSKLARNFKWMRMIYNIALHEFRKIEKNYGKDVEAFVKKCRKLFYETGIEALMENGEWIGIFEERAPEMPK